MDPNTSTPSTQEPQKNNTMMFVIGIVVLLLIGVGVVFVLNSNTTQEAQTQAPSAAPTTAMEQSPAAENTTPSPSEATKGEVKEFTVTGKNFSFSPSTIRVKQGDTVKIVFENTGGTHDFVIDEFDVATAQIQGGKSETVEFVANKKGTFDYYCSVGQHRQNGMEGQLIVE